MKKYISMLAPFFLLACGTPRVDKEGEIEKLMRISEEWSKAAGTDSLEKILSYWADDAVVLSPGMATVKGKAAIREFVESSLKMPGFKISWKPISVEVSKSGDLAYMLEENQISVNDSLGHPMTDINKGVTVWRKEEDGTWKNAVDIWNSNPAAKH
ncbi:MAG: YybH family protein [Chitinophagales bacterium]